MNISKEEKLYINQQLPDLEKLLMEGESRDFHKSAISIFDGWIKTRDEHDLTFNWKDINELNERRAKFESFISKIYSKTPVFTWKYKRRNQLFINKPSRFEILEANCDIRRLTEDRAYQYSIIIPEFSAVYEEYYDWSNPLWFKDKNQVEPLFELAKESGLFHMDWE